MSKLKPCPICGATLRIYSPEDWKPSCCNPHRSGDPYSADCDCGFQYSNGSYDYAEFVAALNRRAQPANEPLTRKHLRSMNDQSVWVQYSEIGMAALVAYHVDDDDGDDVYFTNNLGGRSTFGEVLERGGAVYRRKPEGSENHA